MFVWKCHSVYGVLVAVNHSVARSLLLGYSSVFHLERKFHDIFAPGSKNSTFSLLGTRVPCHFCFQERTFHDIFAPGSESSIYGTDQITVVDVDYVTTIGVPFYALSKQPVTIRDVKYFFFLNSNFGYWNLNSVLTVYVLEIQLQRISFALYFRPRYSITYAAETGPSVSCISGSVQVTVAVGGQSVEVEPTAFF